MPIISSTPPIKIHVYKNGDIHSAPKRILVLQSRYKSYEQFLTFLTNEIGLTNGAVRKLFSMSDKVQVLAMTDLVPNTPYLAVGNEPIQWLNGQYKQISERSSTTSKLNINGPSTQYPSQQQQSLFRMDSKGFRVAVFKFGDLISPPARMVLCFRNCHTYEQLMNEITAVVKLKQGRVRRIYDLATKKEISSLQDLHDGQNILASAYARSLHIKEKSHYTLIDFQLPTVTQRRYSSLAPTPNPASVLKLITVYPNGDPTHLGYQLTISPPKFRDLSKLLTHISHELPMYTGKPTHLCEFSGLKITSMDQLVHHGNYVLCSGTDKFHPPAVPTMAMSSIVRANEVLERSKKLLLHHPPISETAPPPPPPPVLHSVRLPLNPVVEEDVQVPSTGDELKTFSSSCSPPPLPVDLSVKRTGVIHSSSNLTFLAQNHSSESGRCPESPAPSS